MAIDIAVAISGSDIKNGTMVTLFGTVTGQSLQTINTYVKNYPTIAEIDEKYADRFDDPSYYYGSSLDGGGA